MVQACLWYDAAHMKVAFTSDVYWPRINGVTVSTTIFMNELRKLGHKVAIWAPAYPAVGGPGHSGEPAGEVHRLRSFSLVVSREDRLPFPMQRGRFFRQIDQFKPDIIHVQTEFSLNMMVKVYARHRSIPVVQTCHTLFEQYATIYFPYLPQSISRAFARWMTYKLFNNADAVVAPTEMMKTLLESYGITCPITVVPTGIPEEEFQGVDRAQERRNSAWFHRFPQLRGRKILLYVGRVAKEKNMDFLLDMLTLTRQEVPDVVLLVTGNGPYREGFEAEVFQRGLQDSVVCLGYVERPQLKHLYSLADVFTFASITETQGLVTIEAMMCGTPAVAVGKMGTKEVMAGDNGGYMVDEDPQVFSAAVVRLLSDSALYATKSAEAWSYARNWTAQRMGQRLESLYQTVVKDYKRRAPRH